MKKLVGVIVVAIVGLVGFNYATTGEFTLVPSFSKSEEERAVQELQDRFAVAKKQFDQAYRTAAVAGIDTTSDADAALGSVKRIKRELASLRKKLSEDRAKRKADELARAVQEFENKLR
jgi:hypothetical protein